MKTGVPQIARMQERPSSLRDVVSLLRPTQWSKNAVLFAALMFSKHLFNLDAVVVVSLGFVAFCALASGTYVMNDLWDCDRDREHPLKSLRPLPSGRVRRGTAVAMAVGLVVVGLAGTALLSRWFGVLAGLYFLLQLAYTFWLKEVVILDVMAIASGFVIRAVAGGVIIAVPVSPWLIICTFLLALFLGFSKRRHELILLEARAIDHRASLKEYSPYFLDQMIAVVTASTVVAYAIYTVSPEVREKLGTDKLYLTIPFVLFGIFRYLYLVHQREEGGNPTQLLLSDQPLLLDVLLWIVTAALLLYWTP
ncbi:MAG: Decaprenyl-phosphate phosphoribosyltransferase [Deltaproteobacteria bacterium]|nr:Decaprenyl-phosphate phosphoribosyltransferase [Deltaproteobacteria bacterium]